MTDLKPNAELAWRVLDHIDAHPEQWDQKKWIADGDCGTVACFAGWTVLLAGHKVTFGDPDEVGDRDPDAIDGDNTVLVAQVAVRDLGISGLTLPCTGCPSGCTATTRASDLLFDFGNNRSGLGVHVARIFGPRPVSESAMDAAIVAIADDLDRNPDGGA